jgi:hypothetical protein
MSLPSSHEPYRVDHVKAVRETAKALVVLIAGEQHLIPKSQIDADSEVWAPGDEGTLVIPEWLAVDRGL